VTFRYINFKHLISEFAKFRGIVHFTFLYADYISHNSSRTRAYKCLSLCYDECSTKSLSNMRAKEFYVNIVYKFRNCYHATKLFAVGLLVNSDINVKKFKKKYA